MLINRMIPVFIIGISVFTRTGHADTVYLKNQDIQKGIVVEDYKDRVVFSTIDGEKAIMKKDIEMVMYDEPVDNLVNLGKQYQQKNDLEKALYYYRKAYEINPDSADAKNGISYLTGTLFRQEEERKKELIRQRETIENWRAIGNEAIPESVKTEDKDTLKDELGMELVPHGENFKVSSVIRDSPSDDAGIKQGDIVVGVWGKLTGYLSIDELKGLLIGPAHREIKIIIQRHINIRKKKVSFFPRPSAIIDADLTMSLDGLSVAAVKQAGAAEAAGLEKEDLICAIDGRSTRYMPIKEVMSLIKNNQRSDVEFDVRRELVMWKK